MGAILRTVAEEGRTIVFSSHLLDEVERMSDRLVIIEGGALSCPVISTTCALPA